MSRVDTSLARNPALSALTCLVILKVHVFFTIVVQRNVAVHKAKLHGMYKFHDVLDHQLKNKFIAIGGCVDLLLNSGEVFSGEAMQMIGVIRNTCERGTTECYNQQVTIKLLGPDSGHLILPMPLSL